MLIHVNRSGEQFGPYTIEDLNAYLAQGSILPSDQAWYEGAAGWMPMDQVPGIVLSDMATVPLAQPVANDARAKENPVTATANAAPLPTEGDKGGFSLMGVMVLPIVGALLYAFNTSSSIEGNVDKQEQKRKQAEEEKRKLNDSLKNIKIPDPFQIK